MNNDPARISKVTFVIPIINPDIAYPSAHESPLMTQSAFEKDNVISKLSSSNEILSFEKKSCSDGIVSEHGNTRVNNLIMFNNESRKQENDKLEADFDPETIKYFFKSAKLFWSYYDSYPDVKCEPLLPFEDCVKTLGTNYDLFWVLIDHRFFKGVCDNFKRGLITNESSPKVDPVEYIQIEDDDPANPNEIDLVADYSEPISSRAGSVKRPPKIRNSSAKLKIFEVWQDLKQEIKTDETIKRKFERVFKQSELNPHMNPQVVKIANSGYVSERQLITFEHYLDKKSLVNSERIKILKAQAESRKLLRESMKIPRSSVGFTNFVDKMENEPVNAFNLNLFEFTIEKKFIERSQMKSKLTEKMEKDSKSKALPLKLKDDCCQICNNEESLDENKLVYCSVT